MQVGQRLLQKHKGISGLLRAPFEELINEHGMGEAKAAQVKAAIELGNRLTLEAPEERHTITSPADAAALVSFEMSARVAGVRRLTQRSIAHSMSQNWDESSGDNQITWMGNLKGKIAFW